MDGLLEALLEETLVDGFVALLGKVLLSYLPPLGLNQLQRKSFEDGGSFLKMSNISSKPLDFAGIDDFGIVVVGVHSKF